MKSLFAVTNICLLLFFSLFICSCAPSLYSINIAYEPAKIVSGPIEGVKKELVTVAVFNDLRALPDDLLIGHVQWPNGNQVPIIPKNLKPASAVASGIKDYLRKAGAMVGYGMPVWNLQEKNIKKDWGRILIGGNIDKMEIVCSNDLPMKKYHAEVKFTLFLADVQKGKIVYIVSTTGATSLEHVILSEAILEKQFNQALSSAIEDIFGSNAVKTKIREILQ